MKKTGIAIAVVVALGAVATGGAWYTGQQLEGVLRDSIEKGNKQLADLLPEQNIKMELASFERGFFSSNASYRISWGEASADAAQPEIVVLDHLEHGPFPVSRVLKLKLLPVMAVSSGELQRNELLEPIFKVFEPGVKPVVSHSVIGYDRSVSGDLLLAPFTYQDSEAKATFSGLNIEYETSKDADKIKLDADLQRVALEFFDAQQGTLELAGLRFKSDRTLGQSGFYNGAGEFSVERIKLDLENNQTLQLNNFVQRDQSSEDAKNLAGSLSYQIASIEYNGKSLGSATMDWSIADFDVVALKTLSDSYDSWAARLQLDPNAQPTDAEEQALEQGLLALLAGKPKLALDDFTFKSANGQGSLSLKLGFAKPESFELPPEVLLQQLLSSLDLRIAVDKAMITDVLGYQTLVDPELDPQQVAMESSMAVAMASEMASAMQLATVDADKLVSTLKYADGVVNFNGNEMPLQDFVMLMAMLSPNAMGAGAIADETDESDAEDSDEIIELIEEEQEQPQAASAIERSLKAQGE